MGIWLNRSQSFPSAVSPHFQPPNPLLVPKLGSSLVSSRQYSRDELGVGISASFCHRVQRESLILLPCGCEGAVEAMVHYNHPGALKGSPKEDIFLRILYPKPLNPPPRSWCAFSFLTRELRNSSLSFFALAAGELYIFHLASENLQ